MEQLQLAYMNMQLMDFYGISLGDVAVELGWGIQKVAQNLKHAKSEARLLEIDSAISHLIDSQGELAESVV